MMSDTMLFQSTPSTTSLMLLTAPSVELCPPKNVGLQFVSVAIKHKLCVVSINGISIGNIHIKKLIDYIKSS